MNIERVIDRASKESFGFLARFMPMTSEGLKQSLLDGSQKTMEDVEALAISVTMLVLSLKKMEDTGIYPKGGLEALQKTLEPIFEGMWKELKGGGR